jgi:methanogenic corrinoid protein MtbC1
MDTPSFQQAFVSALRAGDERLARKIVDQACAANVSVEAIYYQIFAPSLERIGSLWEQNQFDVASEHLATAITERQMARVAPRIVVPETPIGTVVLGCVAGERHVLGLRMVADMFRLYGWNVLDLGPDVPTNDWVKLMQRCGARAVGISVNARRHLPTCVGLISSLRAALPKLDIVVGGAAFDREPEAWKSVRATLYDADPVTCVSRLTARVQQPAA